MEALELLLTTDTGLLSLGAILFMVVMAIYMSSRFRKLMNQEPGRKAGNRSTRPSGIPDLTNATARRYVAPQQCCNAAIP